MIEAFKIPYRLIKKELRWLKVLYWAVLDIKYHVNPQAVYNIPIFINNFNRLTFPLRLISFLESCGFTNIFILDNASDYPPLLNYYKYSKHRVVHLKKNYGYLAFWKSGLYKKYRWDYFIYTDSDVVPIENCPKDFIERFKQILNKNHRLDKVGFGIKIDDLPNHFTFKEQVIKHESKFWVEEVEPGVYKAQIDTTFALYKPLTNLKVGEVSNLPACRLGHPYLIHHLPWYSDYKNLSEEEKYYFQTANNSSSIGKQNKGNELVY